MIDILYTPPDPYPDCFKGFPSNSDTKARSITDVTFTSNDHRLFRNLRFLCNGVITSLIVGAKQSSGTVLPVIEIWREMSGSNFEKVNNIFLSLTNATTTSDSNLYTYNLAPSVSIKQGDFIGINQQNNQRLQIYYQVNSGPPNYDDQNSLINSKNDYPMLSILGKCETIVFDHYMLI